MGESSDIAAGRLSSDALAANFADAHPSLSDDAALVEADRCYFCHDAPCIEACPTGIDVPGFIRAIATGNIRGAAQTILQQNILGGTCARVCPTEVLCEQACVRTAQEQRPINIGALQRHATDWQMRQSTHPFSRAQPTGRQIAVVGAGPAGLACAHALARAGHDVVIFEAKPNPGGLNEYGIAAYKMADDFAYREVGFILGIGGIRIEHGKALGRDITLATLRHSFDAIFLAIGQAGVNALGLPREDLVGVRDAVDFIADLRQSADKSTLPIGRRVVVIGGGNTAIDAATQARRLGAEEVAIVYRRGPAQMSATSAEQDWAQTNGVTIRHWAAPVALEGSGGQLGSVLFARTRLAADGRLVIGEERFAIPTDMLLKAVGQHLLWPEEGAEQPAIENGRITVDPHTGQTSIPRVFAGGDCVAGPDLTVHAVQDGKRAAAAIDHLLAA
ncbi:MAG TPA: NAD(P)-dependent oxidoreductase [Acetobacteraceae bacterium]|nr:NAD(P)-dependent oxidoreductase [Acetobacteraceae bacterium]